MLNEKKILKIWRKKSLKRLVVIAESDTFALANLMVGVAQLVRVSDCGPEGRGFDPHFPPKEKAESHTKTVWLFLLFIYMHLFSLRQNPINLALFV